MKLEPLLRVKSRQGERTDLCQKSDKSEKPNLDTKKELAVTSGISHDTIARGKVIQAKASEETKAALASVPRRWHQRRRKIREKLAVRFLQN